MSPKSNEREARVARERLRRYNARKTVHENQVKRRKRDNIIAVAGVVLVATVAAGLQIFYFSAGPGAPTPSASASAGQNVGNVPDPGLAEGKSYTGSLVLNDNVSLELNLDAALAPQAVSSILADTGSGYYLGKTCHRLVQSESAGLIQCGSLDGNGTTDPTYQFGPIENAPIDQIYPAGTIAMARVGGDAYSNGRQFFIVVQETTLPNDAAGGYSVVGQVTSGLDSLINQITSPGTTDGSGDGLPLVPTTITGFTIQ